MATERNARTLRLLLCKPDLMTTTSPPVDPADLFVALLPHEDLTERNGRGMESGYYTRWTLDGVLARTSWISPRRREWLEGVAARLREREPELATGEPDPGACPLDAEDAQRLVRFFFPAVNPVGRLGALARPVDPKGLLVAPELGEILGRGTVRLAPDRSTINETLVAGLLILNQHYGQHLAIEQRRIIEARDERSGLTTYYAMKPTYDYVDVVLTGERPHVDEETIRQLLSNPEDVGLWLATLPPEVFSFEGIQVAQIFDATGEVCLSRLQNLLMKRDTVLSERRLAQIQESMTHYLRVPDLRLGVMAVDYPRRRGVRPSQLIRQDILADKVPDILAPELGNTIYYEACVEGRTTIYDDLRDCRADNGPLDELVIEAGYRSLVLVPLLGRNHSVIGIVELASAKPRAFQKLALYQLEAVIPLFRQAMRRSRDEMETKVQTVMRQTFTALDPSVEWRFIEAATEIIERELADTDETGSLWTPEIRFEDVWALYAQADIVSSSKLRNQAIREDLITELTVAEQLLGEARVKQTYPLAGKLVYDIQELLHLLDEAMSPGDEQQVQEFLELAFQPMFEQLRGMPSMSQVVADYLNTLAAARPNGQTQREAYERSVRAVTGLVSRVIVRAQERAQEIVPHYFSKYRTDGVEYNIYAGQSLLQEGKFSAIHLQNLRLWQLQTMIDVTKAVSRLAPRLPTPMSTAQLIFAFGTPITIQFRMDEKRFDVEGAYNVRYEIIKKRIDKALVRGTEERLTLANHVAVVYSHHSDADNYRELIEYLYGTGQIAGELEELELEPMQGVDGLSALRMRVI